MKRIVTGSFALLAMVLAPAASFGRDRYCSRDRQGYQYAEPVQSRYYNDADRYYGQRYSYQEPREYNYNYDRNTYGYGYGNRVGRSAAYVGAGAAAGAIIGAVAGHGSGAAIGAIAGGVGGYILKQHNDRHYSGRRY